MFRKYSILVVLLLVSLVQTACSGPVEEARRVRGIPWWVWLVIIVVMVAVFLWLWLSEPKKKAAPPAKAEAEAPPTRAETAAPSQVVEAPEVAARPTPTVPDDLTRIEGIGPKISGLLQVAGIVTFAHLASTDVKRLKQIIAEAGLTALADPTTWPEQAGLAATGQWSELETLQEELKGGRRA